MSCVTFQLFCLSDSIVQNWGLDAAGQQQRFVNDILELRVLFSELMEVMSRNHYEQSHIPRAMKDTGTFHSGAM